MKFMKIFLVVIVAGVILACATAADKSHKSQTAVNKERLELIDQYKKCMKNAEKNKTEGTECEQYLKAAEALK